MDLKVGGGERERFNDIDGGVGRRVRGCALTCGSGI